MTPEAKSEIVHRIADLVEQLEPHCLHMALAYLESLAVGATAREAVHAAGIDPALLADGRVIIADIFQRVFTNKH